MKFKFSKDCRLRYKFLNFERVKLLFRYVMYNSNLKKPLQYCVSKRFFKLPQGSSICRIQNRCLVSNRSRAVFKKFKLSRHAFKKLASSGKLPGVRKSS